MPTRILGRFPPTGARRIMLRSCQRRSRQRSHQASQALVAVRPPAVAGLFYPRDPVELGREVEALLAASEASGAQRSHGWVKAVIAPHAGYTYSGPVAGSAFAAFETTPGAVGRVVVIGPSHHVAFRGLALPAARALAIPGARMPVDAEAREQLLALDAVCLDPRPHAREHALEVELPFLASRFGPVMVVPLVVGEASVAEVARALDVVWGGDETRIVVSSDLSHFLPYDIAQRRDETTARTIEALDGPLRPDQACGARAIDGLLCLAARRGLVAQRLDLRNSGDTAGGRERVVGYGAWAFCRPAEPGSA